MIFVKLWLSLDGSGSTEEPDTGGDNEGTEPEASDYDLVAPTGPFTNILDVATEAGGATIYNDGNGYKNDTRYSTSSSAFVNCPGWDITGYFPCKVGDVIRFYNVEYMDMNNTGGEYKRNRVMFWDSNYNYLSATDVATLENKGTSAVASMELVYGDNGDVIQLTIPTSYGSNVAYATVTAKNITGASIITVNEEINV